MNLIARPTQILKILQFKFLSTSKQITIKSLRNEVEKQKRFELLRTENLHFELFSGYERK